MRPTAAVDAHRRSPTASLLLLLLGVALLLGAADAKKKSPAKKVGFLKTTEKRSKYATWVFEQYDEDGNGKLTEAEIDTANDEEPPVQIQKDVEDTLELFDLDLLDKDPVDLRVSRAELLAKLEDLEERRLSAIETWCGRRLASSQPALLLRRSHANSPSDPAAAASAAAAAAAAAAASAVAIGTGSCGRRTSKRCGTSSTNCTRSARPLSTRPSGRKAAGRASLTNGASTCRTKTWTTWLTSTHTRNFELLRSRQQLRVFGLPHACLRIIVWHA
jgi:hypothetical protein